MKHLASKRLCAAIVAGLCGVAILLVGGRPVWADSPNEAAPAAEAKVSPSKYWIGVQCEPAGEAVRVQLGLPKDQGLVVVRVMPDGPAAKADIRPNDLLLTAGDKKLAAVSDLAAAVEATKDGSLKIKLLRGGKPVEVLVRPGLRPQELQADSARPDNDREMVEQWMKQFGMNAPGQWGNGITFVHPGAGLVLPPGVKLRPELPDDMSVDIHREGKKPAEITVKKGDKTWKATEDEMSKLPEGIRKEVEPLLHDGPVRLWFREFNSSAAPADAPAGKGNERANANGENSTPNPPNVRRQSSSSRDLDDLSRQLDEMRQTLQELRDRQQHD